jgi:hypothetical protein
VRVKIVLGLLLVMFVGFGAALAGKERTPHVAPSPPAPSTATAATSASAASSASAGSSAAPPGSAAVEGDGGPVKLFDRPLRVIALGWDLAAPAVLANGGVEPGDKSEFTAAGLEVHVTAVDAMTAVEGALARGGGDKDGADIAVVPFSDLVASYERLRALSPEAFFVVGWSRGREALVSARDALPSPNDKPDAKPVDPKAGVPLVGEAGDAATFLGLFALDANGIPPGAVHLVPAGARPEDAPLAAVDRDAPADPGRRNILITTADASRLVPFVAVAQHGLLEKSPKALAAFSHVWLEGNKRLESDPPAAARQISAAQGAPEPIALLKRLGEISSASLGDNARVFGLSGRGALTLEALFQQAWRIWRGASVLATPAPEAAPVNAGVVASLARAGVGAAPRLAPKGAPANADTLHALVTFRQPEGKLDDPALLAELGLLADVFERSALRVGVVKAGGVDAAATKKLVDEAAERFDVAPVRLVTAKKAPAKSAAAIEVLAAP